MRDVSRTQRFGPPVNIRFEPRERARLLRIASRFSLTPSTLVRVAVRLKLPEWERGPLVLAPYDETAEA
jgi:hypothetical protein